MITVMEPFIVGTATRLCRDDEAEYKTSILRQDKGHCKTVPMTVDASRRHA